LAFFLNPEISVAKKTKRRGFLWHKAFDLIANVVDRDRPMAEQDTDLLRKAGLYNRPIAPNYQINTNQDDVKYIKDWLYQKGLHLRKKIIVIHASSRWRFKEIPIETWIQVVQELTSNGYEIILTGSKQDYERNLQIKNKVHSKINIVDFSLPRTAALFSLSSLLISIDSVSIHLASAVGLKVAAIFGPTQDSIWSPWRVKNKIISLSAIDSPSFACRPCGQDGCGGGKVSYCLVAIESKKIVSDALSIIH
jgi:heptosyltransferase-3